MLGTIGRVLMVLSAGLLLIVAVVQWQTGEFAVNGAALLGLILFGVGAVVYLHDHDDEEAKR
jgi:hypothetical protein